MPRPYSIFNAVLIVVGIWVLFQYAEMTAYEPQGPPVLFKHWR